MRFQPISPNSERFIPIWTNKKNPHRFTKPMWIQTISVTLQQNEYTVPASVQTGPHCTA